MEDILSALFFQSSYNAQLVSIATSLQGAAAGLLGTYLLFRRRSLIADALSHASLPGVAAGFLCAYFLFGAESHGRVEWLIFGGAFVAMLLCLGFVHFVAQWTRQDTAIAMALSGFYGLGIVLLSYIQSLPTGAAAGLETFILGQSATINRTETQLIAGGAIMLLGLSAMLHKEWTLLCFDQSYAFSQGYSVRLLDAILMLLAVVVIALGIKAMGLILIIALLTIPALTAILLFKNWRGSLFGAALLGSLSSHIGTSLSAGLAGVPSGVAIVLVCAGFYAIALMSNRDALARFLAY